MSWILVFLLLGAWGLGLVNGYAFGGLIHILLMFAVLLVLGWWFQRRRPA